MGCRVRFLSFVVVAAAVCSWSITACKSTPSVGEAQGGAIGNLSSGEGGNSGVAGSTDNGQDSAVARPIIVLPDASAAAASEDVWRE